MVEEGVKTTSLHRHYMPRCSVHHSFVFLSTVGTERVGGIGVGRLSMPGPVNKTLPHPPPPRMEQLGCENRWCKFWCKNSHELLGISFPISFLHFVLNIRNFKIGMVEVVQGWCQPSRKSLLYNVSRNRFSTEIVESTGAVWRLFPLFVQFCFLEHSIHFELNANNSGKWGSGAWARGRRTEQRAVTPDHTDPSRGKESRSCTPNPAHMLVTCGWGPLSRQIPDSCLGQRIRGPQGGK